MATVNVMLEKHVKKDQTRQIIIRVRHNTKQKDYGTGYSVLPGDLQGDVVINHPEKKKVNAVIKKMKSEVESYISMCELNNKLFRFSELFVKESSIDPSKRITFNDWLTKEGNEYGDRGSIGMMEEYLKIAKIVSKWKQEVMFTDLQEDGVLIKLEKFMRENCQNGSNTRQHRFAIMRQSYERAMYKGYAPLPNPFKGYRIKGDKQKKEKLTVEEILLLRNYKSSRPNRNLARDMFLLSYFTRGIRFENVLCIKKSDITNKTIAFQMVKSNKPGYQEIHSALQELLDRWMDTPGEYLFPIMKKELDRKSKEFLDFKKSQGTNIGRALTLIMKRLGIKKHITFHCARHTFAYHMLLSEAPIKAIQQALGHSNIETTQIYLDDLENKVVDDYTNKMYTSQLHVA